MMYYCAYGSNLNFEQMAYRCPTAKPYGCGLLNGYRLMFRKYATIEPCEGNSVPFAVWEIDDICERSLDIYEGFPRLYRKEHVSLEVNGKVITAMVYIENESVRSYELPSERYFAIVKQGYEDVGLDVAYLYAAWNNTLHCRDL